MSEQTIRESRRSVSNSLGEYGRATFAISDASTLVAGEELQDERCGWGACRHNDGCQAFKGTIYDTVCQTCGHSIHEHW